MTSVVVCHYQVVDTTLKDAVDPDALLSAIKEKFAQKEELSAPELKEVFMGLSYDKVKVEEEEAAADEAGEGGEDAEDAAEDNGEEKPAKAPKAPPKQEISKNAEATFALLNPDKKDSLSVRHILSALNLCKNGFGESAVRFTVKVLDAENAGGLKEPDVWYIVTQCANSPLDPIARNHLRRAWRAAEKQPLPGEGGEEGGEGGEAQPPEEAAPAADTEDGSGEASAEGESKRAEKPKLGPDDVKVVVDDFLNKISEDDKLTSILFKDLAIPDRPKEADENLPPAEDD